MNIEEFREYCLMKPGTTEEFPFDLTTLVFKVAGKMYALTDLEESFSIALKCDPEYSIELQEQYPSVTAAYHMNKKHWITVQVNDFHNDRVLLELIDKSYNLVFKNLTQKTRSLIVGD